MMLRKRTRTHHKEQPIMGHISTTTTLPDSSISESQFHSDLLGQRHKPNSLFNVPAGLLVGFNPKNSDFESVRSPTSPLDFRVFSNLGSPFRSPKALREGHQKVWDCEKVGLSIIDSIDDNAIQSEKKALASSSEGKNILFGPQLRIKTPNGAPNSLPKNYPILFKPSILQKGNSDVLFGIGRALLEPEPFGKTLSCSLDSGRFGPPPHLRNRNANSKLGNSLSENGRMLERSPPECIGGTQAFGNVPGEKANPIPISNGSGPGFFRVISASEIELSEDYTCVKTRGPNPKTTHIFGDRILECHDDELTNFVKKEEEEIILPLVEEEEVNFSELPLPPLPSNDFLSFCYSCKKELDGEDIYMYRGEKAFCSWNCRSEEILIEEAMEKTANDPSEDSSQLNEREELSETTMFIAA